jgi:hypothetical protein
MMVLAIFILLALTGAALTVWTPLGVIVFIVGMVALAGIDTWLKTERDIGRARYRMAVRAEARRRNAQGRRKR